MSDECLDLIEERRKVKTLGSQSPEYKKVCKEEQKACKKAEKEWLEAKAVDSESAFARGHSKKVYHLVRELGGKQIKNKGIGIKDADGSFFVRKR